MNDLKIDLCLMAMGLSPATLEWDKKRIDLEKEVGIKHQILSIDKLNENFDKILDGLR